MSGATVATVAAVATTAIAAAGTVYSLTRPSPQAPRLPDQGTAPPVPQYTDPSVQAAAAASQAANQRAAGRASTILTSGQGDTSALTTNKKALLGAG